MYSEKLYQEALEHFDYEVEHSIENDYVKKYAEELIYCYLNKKDLLDFDFWTQYEELLGEKISYQEYSHIDGLFDDSPLDVEPEDMEIISGFRRDLENYREEQVVVGSVTVHSLKTITEAGDGIRDFFVTDFSLDRHVTREAFMEVLGSNPHFTDNGIYREDRDSIESNYVDGIGFTRLELQTKEVSFSKESLREFLKGIDKEILKEVLPEELRQDSLMAFIEEEVPYRMENEHGIFLTEDIKKELVDIVQNDVEIIIDYDKFDKNLKNLHEDLVKEKMNSYDTMIAHLCELLNKQEGGEFNRKSEQFEVFFESEHYFGVYFYNGENEYYLVNKESGNFELALGDSPEFVGKYTLSCLENEGKIQVENKEKFDWFVDFSRTNLERFVPEFDLQGLHVLEYARMSTDELVRRIQFAKDVETELVEKVYVGVADALAFYTDSFYPSDVVKEILDDKEGQLVNTIPPVSGKPFDYYYRDPSEEVKNINGKILPYVFRGPDSHESRKVVSDMLDFLARNGYVYQNYIKISEISTPSKNGVDELILDAKAQAVMSRDISKDEQEIEVRKNSDGPER